MIGLVVVNLMVFYTFDELVLREIVPILRNGQKQPPQVFYKRSCSLKFRKIHTKGPLHREAFSCGFCKIYKKTCFIEHLCVTASKWVWNLEQHL